MGLFGGKGSKASTIGVAKPPPVFNKHSEENMLKGYNRVRRASLAGGSVASLSSRKRAALSANPNAANGDFVIPPFIGDSVGSAESYIEEIVDDESYEEEIIEEEYSIEEEEIIEIAHDLPPRKITIRFDGFDEMQNTLHINDYTKQEINKSWFKRDDYDKMVQTARKTVEKIEERQKEQVKVSSKKRSSLKARGLEAWTTLGSTKARLVKENALEAVWNEQARQWNAGDSDPEKMRELYVGMSKGAVVAAKDQGLADAKVVEQIRKNAEQEEIKKRRRKLLGKSKALLGKSMRATTGGMVKTGKLVGKTTVMTGKVAFGAGKVATKTAVATATLDRRMLKEALSIERRHGKKKDVHRQIYRQPSRGSRICLQELDDSLSVDSRSVDELSVATETRKRHKLKLLGVVPIPGTQKMYKDDIEQKKLAGRKNKMSRMPSWESGLSSGKY